MALPFWVGGKPSLLMFLTFFMGPRIQLASAIGSN